MGKKRSQSLRDAGRDVIVLLTTGTIMMFFAAPIAAVALLFVIFSPLRAARPDNFYAGSATVADSLRRLAWATVEHRRAWRDTPIADAARDALAFFLGPAILIAGLVTRRSLLVTLSASMCTCTILTSLSRIFIISWSVGRSWLIWAGFTSGGRR